VKTWTTLWIAVLCSRPGLAVAVLLGRPVCYRMRVQGRLIPGSYARIVETGFGPEIEP